jgi:hypothetical protein
MMIMVTFTTMSFVLGSVETVGSEFEEVIISPLQIQTNRPMYKQGEEIGVLLTNTGKADVTFDVLPKIQIKDENGNVVYPTVPIRRYQSQYPAQLKSMTNLNSPEAWKLSSGESEGYLWDQMTISTEDLDPGIYTIETVSDLPAHLEDSAIFVIRERGYVIIVSGNNNDDKADRINEATNQIYDDMMSIGYPASRVYYLNDWYNYRVDNTATSAHVESAIKVWAATKVDPTEPLFIIMFSHGGVNNFCIDNDEVGNDNVFAGDMNDWIEDLETATDADVYTWIMTCHSGSFIDDLSADGRVTITSCQQAESSTVAPAPYHENFASQYWPEIKSGSSLGAAFNVGSHYVAETLSAYHPLLDDNADGVGHGWDTPNPSGYLPHDGDGGLAPFIYMGGDPLPMPHIPDLVSRLPYRWPIPPEPIIIEAVVESLVPITEVRAVLIPPVQPQLPNFQVNEDLIDIQYEYFDMSDPDGDGTWSVAIPSSEFEDLIIRPAEFDIMVIVEDENGQSAQPAVTGVEFSTNGELSPDYNPPGVRIISPKYLEIVQGTVTITAVAMDDTCVAKVEIIVDDVLVDTINLPDSANFEFEYELDTSDLEDGGHVVQLRVYDESGNSETQETVLAVGNNALVIPIALFKDAAITELTLAKTGAKKVDMDIDKAIEHIQDSLDPALWVDANHADPKHGHKVFVMEKQAVMKINELLKHKNLPATVVAACNLAILYLVTSDFELARALYIDASVFAGTNDKVDHHLDIAWYKFQNGFSAVTAGDMGKAIDDFKGAWENSGQAIKFS